MADTARARHTPGDAEVPAITASVALGPPPSWAVLQRHLFAVLDKAWRRFAKRFCGEDGRLEFSGPMLGRDGADDFYEPFFNWPLLYLLGGSDDLLEACKHHWEGVTAQLTELGLLKDEYERGYDWFHQGESLLFFYGICAADPKDEAFRERARRFAELYLPGGPNYDVEHNLIPAPHNGAEGLRPGLGEDWDDFPRRHPSMEIYGLPLHFVPDIYKWSDLEDPEKASAMLAAMHRSMGEGDAVVNLASTSLVTNWWLYDGDSRAAEWVLTYVDGWVRRARENGGLVPDNVSPEGIVGGAHEGRWYGGSYGWTWPHGLLSVEAAALVGASNSALISGEPDVFDLARVPLERVMEQARWVRVESMPEDFRREWLQRVGMHADREAMLVPFRFGRDGWFDLQPMTLSFPTWLWWHTMQEEDRRRLERLCRETTQDWTVVKQFRNKEEAGHEAPWIAYLHGENPNYPERALAMAIGQVAHRSALMELEMPDAASMHIHYWQQVNPVVTEVLTQLTTGSPQVLYNGGLPHMRLRYFDAQSHRPGLPPQVAALVDHLDEASVTVTLVNLDLWGSHAIVIQAGTYGEHRIEAVEATVATSDTYPGPVTEDAVQRQEVGTVRTPVGGNRVEVRLPPNTQLRLRMEMILGAQPARHRAM